MARVTMQALLLCCSLTLGAIVGDGRVSARLVAGLLTVVCALCVARFVGQRRGLLLDAAAAALALAVPPCAVFLPALG
ncbi:MAG: hypothetical protein UHD09_01095, partial [Bifidobacterium sp.]|nr:hypothetical protein [Bifidobacterium sp.]